MNKRLLTLVCLAWCLSGCGRLFRKTSADYLAAGKQQMEKKEFQKGLLNFRAAVALDKTSAEAYYQLGAAYLAVGDLNNSVAALKEATSLDPRHVRAQIDLADLMASLGDINVVKEAETRARAALAASASNAEAITTLALAEIRLGKLEDATARLNALRDSASATSKASVLLALAQMNRKDFDGAANTLRTAAERFDKDPGAQVAYARLMLLRGQADVAEKYLRRAIALEASHPQAVTDLAAIAIANKRDSEAEALFRRLSERPEHAYRTVHAEYLILKGSFSQAIEELQALHVKFRSDRNVRTRLVAALIAAKRAVEASAVLSAALEANRKDSDALLQRSQIRIVAGDYAAAEADLANVVQFLPDSAPAHYLLARLHRIKGSRQNEKRELGEALRLDASLLVARIDFAQTLIEEGAGKAALDLMNAAPASQKGEFAAIVQRNWALWATRDSAALAAGIEQGYRLGRAADLMIQEALLRMHERKFTQARALLTEVLKQNPDDHRALDTLVRSYLDEGASVETALARLADYAAQSKSVQTLHLTGDWLARAGKLGEAREVLRRAQEADPAYKGTSLALARVYLTEGKLEPARQAVTNLLSHRAGDIDAGLLLAMLDEMSGRPLEARRGYETVLRSDPGNLVALNNLAYRLLLDTEKVDDALGMAQRAKQAAPDNPAVDDTVGWAMYQKGLYSGAIRHLQASAAKSPNATRLYHLSMAYSKSGRINEARKAHEAASQLATGTKEAQMSLSALQAAAGPKKN